MTKLAWLSTGLFCFAACGDNLPSTNPDASVDAPEIIDAPIDSPPQTYTPPTPATVPLSATGADQLMSVTAGPNGTFYAAGYAAADLASAKLIVLAKFTAAGELDPAFGTAGVVTTDVEFKGGADEIDIATQSSGKLIVSTTVANLGNPADRDVLVLRFNADGTPDALFGTAGRTRLDLGTARDNGGTLTAFDGVRGLAIGPTDEIYLHALTLASGNAAGGGPRTDTDFVVVKLTALGALDILWGGLDGLHTLDIVESNATPRGITAFADGTVVASGYANSSITNSTQPVLYKLTTAGVRDQAFADGGLFHEVVLAGMTEIYGLAIHGTNIVTGGYGREVATPAINDWVSMRFDIATGDRDLAWGTTQGAVVFDPSGADASANCRSALALPDGKTLLIGSIGPANMPAQDATFAVLSATGALDPAYGDGIHAYQLGGNDQFWGAAVSGTSALIVGWRGGGSTPTASMNDDAAVVLVPLQ